MSKQIQKEGAMGKTSPALPHTVSSEQDEMEMLYMQVLLRHFWDNGLLFTDDFRLGICSVCIQNGAPGMALMQITYPEHIAGYWRVNLYTGVSRAASN